MAACGSTPRRAQPLPASVGRRSLREDARRPSRPEKAAGRERGFPVLDLRRRRRGVVAEIKDGACKVEAGKHAKPHLHDSRWPRADFLALMNGKLPAMQAYTSGKLKIEGDIMKSQLIEKALQNVIDGGDKRYDRNHFLRRLHPPPAGSTAWRSSRRWAGSPRPSSWSPRGSAPCATTTRTASRWRSPPPGTA